ncbi:MAG: integrase core domain-containing protein, partial [Betaproteobacteria bacterium]|nr:integrase core domain-containing protein [Betaproteobacteria bacterium]
WDNAVAESFFATLKVELVHDAAWATRAVARTELFDFLERFYNGQRRHSALGYLSPRAFDPYARLNEQEYRSAGLDDRRLGC